MTNGIENEINKSIGTLIGNILSEMSTRSQRNFEKFQFDIEKGFNEYAHATYDRCGYTKTLISRSHPVAISTIYVDQIFHFNDKDRPERELLEYVRKNGRIVVTGLAGSGKSLFMKSLYHKLFEADGYGFPIFVELRHLKDDYPKSGGLQKYLFDQVLKNAPRFSTTQFEHGMRKGAFSLILDGFDELPIELRKPVESDILLMSRMYPGARIVVSSRPVSRFDAWEEFTIARTMKFSLEQIDILLEKINFDVDKKERFKKALHSGLYVKHRTFLASPLLATMMLLIFDLVGEIPRKLHIFYEKSFDVLSREHDTLKSRYSREMHSSLEIDEVSEIFEIFCTLSYIDQTYVFSKKSLMEYINSAIELAEIEGHIDASELSEDFCESMSVLIEEAGEYSFVHRSFQEYFFSKYSLNNFDKEMREVIIECLPDISRGSIIQMMHGMKPKVVECDLLYPALRPIYLKISKVDPHLEPSKILKFFFGAIGITNAHHLEDNDDYLDFLVSQKTRVDRAGTLVELIEELEIVSDVFPYANDVVLDDRHSKWFEDNQDEMIKVNKTNEGNLLALGGGFMAEKIVSGIECAIVTLETNCQERKKRRSEQLVNRKMKSRQRRV